MMRIRVLVANHPRLMRELVLATISDQPDIEVVGEIQDQTQIETAVLEKKPDFLIVALESSENLPDSCNSMLKNYPNLKIIAIAPDRNASMFYRALLNIQASPIEASEQGVLNALRGGTESGRESL